MRGRFRSDPHPVLITGQLRLALTLINQEHASSGCILTPDWKPCEWGALLLCHRGAAGSRAAGSGSLCSVQALIPSSLCSSESPVSAGA